MTNVSFKQRVNCRSDKGRLDRKEETPWLRYVSSKLRILARVSISAMLCVSVKLATKEVYKAAE